MAAEFASLEAHCARFCTQPNVGCIEE